METTWKSKQNHLNQIAIVLLLFFQLYFVIIAKILACWNIFKFQIISFSICSCAHIFVLLVYTEWGGGGVTFLEFILFHKISGEQMQERSMQS